MKKEFRFGDFLRDEKLYVDDFVMRNLNRSVEMFSYGNLPKEIPLYQYEESLQRNGWLCVFKFDEKIYALPCAISGEPDAYFMPRKVRVVNPYLDIEHGGFNREFTVGEDCEIIRNDTNCIGLLPILTKYAVMSRTAELTLDTLTYLSRVPFLITAKNLNQKDGAEAFLRKVENGEYGVIAGNEFFDSVKTDITPKGERQIADVVEMANYVHSRLFNEIGILADYNGMKKERTAGADTQFATPSLIPLVENMLNERKQGWERANALFGLSVEVDFNSVWQLNMAFLENATRQYLASGVSSEVDVIDEKADASAEGENENDVSKETDEETVAKSGEADAGKPEKPEGDSAEDKGDSGKSAVAEIEEKAEAEKMIESFESEMQELKERESELEKENAEAERMVEKFNDALEELEENIKKREERKDGEEKKDD